MPATKSLITEAPIIIKIQKRNAYFKKIRNPDGPDTGIGTFLLVLDITATKEDIYIPLSIASGKKPTGFIYEIVGTEEGLISTTKISCDGDDISQITLGTILYCKIPATKTGTFRIIVETRGKIGGEYKVIINRTNYKRDASDARYEKFVGDLESKAVKFK
jgi:hypothetical protein